LFSIKVLITLRDKDSILFQLGERQEGTQHTTPSLRFPLPAVEKLAALDRTNLSQKISDFRLNCACLGDIHVAGVLLPLISRVLKTNKK